MPSEHANAPDDGVDEAPSTRQIRGSALLLAGRVLSLGIGFIAQVVIVRYLAKDEYGALAYALSVVSLAASVAALGLDKATSRFLPMYQERGQRGHVLGIALFAAVAMLAIGAAFIALAYIGQQALFGSTDPTAVGLLLVLVFLVPIQALDPLATSILAALSRPRIIFIRRYILAPAFDIIVLAVVVVSAASVVVLAVGQVVAGALGLALYGAAVVTVLRDSGYAARDVRSRLTVPWREVLSYSVPLLSSDLVFVLRGALVVIMLEWYGSTVDVADFRAVFPQARLNLVVLQSFTFLFLPLAARLVTRDDLAGLRRAHGRSTAWVTLMSFPLFAASFVLAGPVVGLVYGERYAGSAIILALLSVGFFASAVLGFAGLTLRALGAVRYIVGVDLLTALLSVALYVVLIPTHGAVGAAVGTMITLVVQGAAYHAGAQRAGGVDTRGEGLLALGAQVLATTFVLVAMQAVLAPPLWVGLPVITAVWVLLLWLNRHLLDVGSTFPEILRVPVVGPLASRVLR